MSEKVSDLNRVFGFQSICNAHPGMQQVSMPSVNEWIVDRIGFRDVLSERQDEERTGEREQVAQGQYVVSDTRCPALHGCKSE